MSFYLHAYEANHTDISQLFSQPRSNVLASIPALKPEASDAAVLERLLAKNYTRDPETWESHEAPALINAFEMLVAAHAQSKKTIEFYLTESLPVLWNFSLNDWDVSDDFGLPLSPSGTPAVIYRDQSSLDSFFKKFQVMQTEGGYNPEYLSEADLNQLVEIVGNAMQNQRGLFIFCGQ